MLTFIVIFVVSGALVVGAAWGIFGSLPDRLEGLLVALAGGALLVSATLELIEPATEQTATWAVAVAVGVGGVVFTALDQLVDRVFGSDSGGGLLAAITLDGVPENLALGVALIGARPLEVAALSGSILLSNLPEAAGGAKQMQEDRSNGKVFALWGATAVLLSLAAIGGRAFLESSSPTTLAIIRSFAAGAVVASLAVEVFPQAFREGDGLTGIAATGGVVAALLLHSL